MELKRLRWRCRRGMLELDLLLEAFLAQGYAQLTPTEQQTFDRLLEQSDQFLLGWLLGNALPSDSELAQLVTRIRHTLAH